MMHESDLEDLSFTVSAYISRPVDEVYEAVADPAQLSAYFTTGGARGRLESGAVVTWDFADFPGEFPVRVVEAERPARIVIEWDAQEAAPGHDGGTRVTFEFESIDEGARTVVRVTESSWNATQAGAKAAFGNCYGWSQMLACLKVWLEHGINLREGFFK